MTIQIRAAQPADGPASAEVIRQAFHGHPHSDQAEHLLVERLRDAGALTVSLVALEDDRIVGHIAFSPVTIDGAAHWHGLAPVSVLPASQRRGIGSALIAAGLARLRDLGAAGCVVLGSPDYYRRFGFRSRDGLACLYPVPPDHFMALSLREALPVPTGEVRYHPAFDAG